MRGHGQKLTRKQELAIAALLSEPSQERAAGRAGVTSETLRRWQRLPAFEAAFKQARSKILDDAITSISQATVDAVRTLRRNLSCGNPSIETRAAQCILSTAFRAKELLELEERVGRLEDQVVDCRTGVGGQK